MYGRYGTSTSGLICSHGSELDTRIPRPKLPKTALPSVLRKKLGLKPRGEGKGEVEDEDDVIWKPGSGVLAAAGSAPDGKFLKRRSGMPRASAGAASVNHRAVISKPRLVTAHATKETTKVSAPLKNSSQNKLPPIQPLHKVKMGKEKVEGNKRATRSTTKKQFVESCASLEIVGHN
jgi:hypothetical protein